MGSRYVRFERQRMDDAERAESRQVDAYARTLADFLESRQDEVASAHVFNAGSKHMQGLVASVLEPLGFESEVSIASAGGYEGGAKVDLYRRLGADRGVIVEVERGGTIQNNHDLKDFWKTHLAVAAHHLFLVVPMANWKSDGAVRERPFKRMPARFAAFFQGDRREVDVLTLHVFGYGADRAIESSDLAAVAEEDPTAVG